MFFTSVSTFLELDLLSRYEDNRSWYIHLSITVIMYIVYSFD